MSNAARTGDDAVQVAYAEGWGPGTDPASPLAVTAPPNCSICSSL